MNAPLRGDIWRTPAGQVWRLVSGLPAVQRKRRRIVVLQPQAAIDDSTDQPHQKHLVLGGFVASASRWAAFSDEWQVALNLKPKLDYFKMNEAVLLIEQFSPDRGWTEELRDDRLITLTRIIKKHVFLRIHASIRRADFEENIANIPLPQRSLISDNPYIYLFVKLFVAMAVRGPVIGLKEACEFIFDEQSGQADEIYENWPLFKASIEARKNPKFPTLFGGKPNFQSDKVFKPLQAADLFANQMRFHIQRNSGRLVVPPNKILHQLMSIPAISHDSTSEEMKRMGRVSRQWRDTLLEITPNDRPMIGFAATSRERRLHRKRGRRAAKKRLSSAKKGQPS